VLFRSLSGQQAVAVMTKAALAALLTPPGEPTPSPCTGQRNPDCLAAGMTADEITVEYQTVTVAGVRSAAAYGAALARKDLLPLPQP